MSRGLNNNNPGNIRISGTKYLGEVVPSKDSSFKQFKTMIWGYRAMFMLLHTYQVKHRLNTIWQMISRYAPPGENDTKGYAKYVSSRSGIAEERIVCTLDGSVMIPIVSAMSRMENGIEAIEAEVKAGWELFISTIKA